MPSGVRIPPGPPSGFVFGLRRDVPTKIFKPKRHGEVSIPQGWERNEDGHPGPPENKSHVDIAPAKDKSVPPMGRQKPCTIALLRPPETSWIAYAEQMRERDGMYVGDGKDKYVPATDDWIDEYRLRLMELADDLKIRCKVEEHQMHGEELHGRRSQFVEEAVILTPLDPSPNFCWFMRDIMKRDTDKRAVVAFSSSDLRDRLLNVIAGARAQMFERGWTSHPGSNVLFLSDTIKRRMIRRMIPFLAHDEKQMRNACRQAFLYPNLPGDAA